MKAEPLTDFSRLCVHTITTKGWGLEEAVEHYADAGVSGITVWRQWLEGKDPSKAGELIRSAGLEVVSLCRGGFYPALEEKSREEAIEDNKRAIEDAAAAMGAPLCRFGVVQCPDNLSSNPATNNRWDRCHLAPG